MAYPYIPGSDTDAFKGIDGAAGAHGHRRRVEHRRPGRRAGSSSCTTRPRSGEYVRIGDRAGTIARIGLFTTTVRTGMGEVLTLPNSQVLGTVTTNYSHTLEGGGFVVTAAVSIGYDAPWRQVHALLLEAARRTDGIAAHPEPRVYQTALSRLLREVPARLPGNAGGSRAACLGHLGALRVDPGCVQRARRPDHVAALPGRSAVAEGRAQGEVARAPRTARVGPAGGRAPAQRVRRR